jgi:RimJ/RimL family protein N-acetyltransferase
MPNIIGSNIMLREYRKEDLEHMRRWVNDPEVVNNLSDIFLFPHSLVQTENFLNGKLEGKGDPGFVIAEKENGVYLGQIDLLNIDWKNRLAQMGIVIGDQEKRGRGYGSEAIRLLQQFVFERLNLNKLELWVHDYNTNAYHCYIKCGFKEEGRIRQSFYLHGRYHDKIFMGVLKSEYQEGRAIIGM